MRPADVPRRSAAPAIELALFAGLCLMILTIQGSHRIDLFQAVDEDDVVQGIAGARSRYALLGERLQKNSDDLLQADVIRPLTPNACRFGIGEDLGNHVPDSAFDLFTSPDELPALDRATFEGAQIPSAAVSAELRFADEASRAALRTAVISTG